MLRTVAAQGEGLSELLDALDRHGRYLEESGELRVRRQERLRERVREIVEQQISRELWNDPGSRSWVEDQIPAMEEGSVSPFEIARELRARSGRILTGVNNSPITGKSE